MFLKPKLKPNRIEIEINNYSDPVHTRTHLDLSGFITLSDRGWVTSICDGIAYTTGLGGVVSNELVLINGNMYGLALNLEKEKVGVIVFGSDRFVGVGSLILRTKKIVSIPVGTDYYLGRVVDSLGNFIDGLGFPRFPDRKSVV